MIRHQLCACAVTLRQDATTTAMLCRHAGTVRETCSGWSSEVVHLLDIFYKCGTKVTSNECNKYLEPQTTISKWLFQLDDSQSLYRKWLFHQTSIYKWLFGVPGRGRYNITPLIGGEIFPRQTTHICSPFFSGLYSVPTHVTWRHSIWIHLGFTGWTWKISWTSRVNLSKLEKYWFS